MPAHTLVPSPETALKHVLVLGSADHPREVTAYEWLKLPAYVNVADYDVVIVNLAALGWVPSDEQSKARQAISDRVPGRGLFGKLWFAKGTEIVVIAEPTISDGVDPFFWSPVELTREASPGRVVDAVEDDWAWYFEQIKLYVHFFTGARQPHVPAERYFRDLGLSGSRYDVNVRPLAKARHGRPIAVEMKLLSKTLYNGSPVTTAISQSAFILPPFGGQGPGDSVNLVLQHRYGFEIKTPSPEWSGKYVLPSHAPVLGELVALQEEIAKAEARLPDVRRREAHAARFQALLYGGDDELELLVREGLEMLGGSVDPPVAKGREDGRVTAPDGHKYMLEVKSSTGLLKIRDVRQLADWVNLGVEDDWDSRGLLVINAFRSTPPDQRRELVPDNALKAARRFGHAVIATTQLFQALSDLEAKKLAAETFWNAIAGADGLVDLPDLAPLPEVASP